MGHRHPGWIAAVLFVAFVSPLAAQPATQAQPVTLRVLMPADDAKLTIQDQATKSTGSDRRFQSPPLQRGKEYIYTVAAIWTPNNYTTITRTREVPVQAGQEVVVDLRKADEQNPDKTFVRYVPTPYDVVEAMLKLGAVGKDDVVFDLGCGDGRIVVTAVQKFGAKRGVGVDLDPERIKDSQANAKQAKVEDKVEFRMEDIHKIKDYADATVVMLYLSDDTNVALRPTLQKTLKPGTRIVSHRFTMGDWKPLKTETFTDHLGEKYLLHLWKIGEDAGK